MKIKIVTGFREDQEFSVDVEESHKAYYLFNNPEKRGVFNNGLAIIGKDIQRIEPDYNSAMGYNPKWKLEPEDWNEIRKFGVDRKFREILNEANLVSRKIEQNPKLISLPLSEARQKINGTETKQIG